MTTLENFYFGNVNPSSSLAVLGRRIRLVRLDLVWRLLLSPTRGACRGPRRARIKRRSCLKQGSKNIEQDKGAVAKLFVLWQP